MTKIDELKYKNFLIEVFYDKESKKIYAISDICSSNDNLQKTLSAKENINIVKNGIDNFLKIVPKNMNELAHALSQTLVWDGYEECHVEEEVLKSLLTNFLKTKGINL
jgi:hypothetical protein